MSAVEIDILEAVEAQQIADRDRSILGIVTAKLIGLANDGRTPLILCPGGAKAAAAQTIVDLHGAHIGHEVVVQFVDGDASRPVIMGVLRDKASWPLGEKPGQVEVDVDGARMLIGASEQLVLKCGKASVTLTKAGKILIQGTYISNRSSGVMRIKGGSVQLN